jgi:hypothetical protein
LESLGTVGGGLSTFGFASVGFKDAMNLFQGPFTSAMKSLLPDFTINQMQRLDDRAFTAQAMVVPKRSSVSMVVFLSRDVFLNRDQQKALGVSWKGKRGTDEGTVLLALQSKLDVDVAGAHVSEVSTNPPPPEPTKVEPKTAAAKDSSVTLTLLGTNLDRVAKVRIGDSTPAQLQLVDSDPTWAKATPSVPTQPGNYHIYLQTESGQDVDTHQMFTVTQ